MNEIKVGNRYAWEDAREQDYLTITKITGNTVYFVCDDGYTSDTNTREVSNWTLLSEATLVSIDTAIIPAHYNEDTIDALAVIDAWKLDFRLGNVVKYIQRHTKKGTPLQDLKKAAQYLALAIKKMGDEQV